MSALQINHLRLHHSGGNEIALKVGIQQALRQTRLPPGVVLVIRRLKTGGFSMRTAEMNRWRHHLEGEIEALAHRALRPATQYIPPGADCVLFADEVELLLEYTRDVLARRTAWYWAEIFPEAAYAGRPIGDQLLTGWQGYPQAIPHIFVELDLSEARKILESLNHRRLSGLVHLLHQTFALPDEVLKAAVSEPIPAEKGREARTRNGIHPPAIANIDGQFSGERIGQTVIEAPWREWLPDDLRGYFSPAAQYVLGLCHMLIFRPQRARTLEFAWRTRTWLEQSMAQWHTAAAVPHSQPIPARSSLPTAVRMPQGEEGWQTAEVSPDPVSTSAMHQPTTRPPNRATDANQSMLPVGIQTNLGGAFFLINLLANVEMPDDQAAPAELNPWELVGAVTVAFLGEAFPTYQADPLWAILSELAGLAADEWWGGDNDDDSSASALAFCSPALARYVLAIRPYLVDYLAHLTGEPVLSFLVQPAVLDYTRTHVDVRFSLEQINIPIRRAGLDRTPGWLPEFGYIVTIYFE